MEHRFPGTVTEKQMATYWKCSTYGTENEFDLMRREVRKGEAMLRDRPSWHLFSSAQGKTATPKSDPITRNANINYKTGISRET